MILGIVHNLTESGFGRLSGLWFAMVMFMVDYAPLESKLKKAYSNVAEKGSRVLNGAASPSGKAVGKDARGALTL